ncbi:MAG: efflux transporter outer membrane subunit [Desulfuromonadales bacterium]|nr:efflux transporter outer membrane subunit [Desulfuromonadales bacterium]
MRESNSILLHCIAGALVATLLTGCTVGPDFRRPAGPGIDAYTASPLPERTTSAPGALGESQRLIEGATIEMQWWRNLEAPKLDALIEQALLTSPTLATVQATLRQAGEIYAAKSGSTRYPQLDANLSGQRQRFNPGALGQSGEAREFSLYSAGVGMQYQLDLTGGNRRALEALAAQVDYQRFQLAGARLTLAAQIASTAISQARLSAQLVSSEAILHAQEQQLALAHERVRLGEASQDDVLALQTQVEQTRADIPALRSQREQAGHLLAVLSGQAPGVTKLPPFNLDDFSLPVDLPLVLPAELVRGRPDILAAEALLHAANAEYGVAIGRLYPQINLSASLGSQALTTGALFGSGSAIWSLIGQLTQPLFNPGLPAEKRAALAAFDAAAAHYQGVVLEALRNVADVLQGLDSDSQILAAQVAAEASAQASLNSAQRKYALGVASYLQLLTAQQQVHQSRLGLIASQAQKLGNTVALYHAMGGGQIIEGAFISEIGHPGSN